jgi:hypothetical protein
VPAALALRRDLDRERGQRVRLVAVVEEADSAGQGSVDARREPRDRPVPGDRDRVTVREREPVLLVVKDELEVVEILV